MELKICSEVKLMSNESLIQWFDENVPKRHFIQAELEEEKRQILERKLAIDFLLVFSNGETGLKGCLIYETSFLDGDLFVDNEFIRADDVMGGGPTQQVIYDFFDFGLSELSKVIAVRKIYFPVQTIYVWRNERNMEKIQKKFKEYGRVELGIEKETFFYEFENKSLLSSLKMKFKKKEK